MGLRIAGIAGKKHPTLKRGDAIPLTDAEKIEAMAKEAVVKSSTEGYLNVPLSARVIGDIQVVKGRKDIKEPEPDQYIGKAEVRYRVNKLEGDKVFPARTIVVALRIKDSTNDIGVEDLEMMEFDLH